MLKIIFVYLVLFVGVCVAVGKQNIYCHCIAKSSYHLTNKFSVLFLSDINFSPSTPIGVTSPNKPKQISNPGRVTRTICRKNVFSGMQCNVKKDPAKCLYGPPICCRRILKILKDGRYECSKKTCVDTSGCECISNTWSCFAAKISSCPDEKLCVN